MVVYSSIVERNKYYGDHAERAHYTGEMGFAAMVDRLKPLDVKILVHDIIPLIPSPLDLFFVGSLTDKAEETYQDIDIHLVPRNDCTYREIWALQQECLRALQANPELTNADISRNTTCRTAPST